MVGQKCFTLPKNLSSPLALIGGCEIMLVNFLCFVEMLFSFSFGHNLACPSYGLGFWLPISYLQIFLTQRKDILITEAKAFISRSDI